MIWWLSNYSYFLGCFHLLRYRGDDGKLVLSFFATMVLVCRAVPRLALANRNDPSAEPQLHVLVVKDNELTYHPWTSRPFSEPLCPLSAELEEPRTPSTLHADRIFKLLFAALWLGCCKVPGTRSPGHSVRSHSSGVQGKEMTRRQICKRRL